jgi:hypothetical protein
MNKNNREFTRSPTIRRSNMSVSHNKGSIPTLVTNLLFGICEENEKRVREKINKHIKDSSLLSLNFHSSRTIRRVCLLGPVHVIWHRSNFSSTFILLCIGLLFILSSYIRLIYLGDKWQGILEVQYFVFSLASHNKATSGRNTSLHLVGLLLKPRLKLRFFLGVYGVLQSLHELYWIA